MDYQKQLNELRDNLHRGIVQESTCKIYQQLDTTDGVLLLRKPILVHVTSYHPEWDDYSEEVRVTAVDCNTGDLIGENLSGNERNVRYMDLSVDTMLLLHTAITSNQYEFTEYAYV